jgi:hypothetical protein
MIKVTTICDFAAEYGMSYITTKKRVEKAGIKPIGVIRGKTKGFDIYDYDEISKASLKPKQVKQVFNVAKLW